MDVLKTLSAIEKRSNRAYFRLLIEDDLEQLLRYIEEDNPGFLKAYENNIVQMTPDELSEFLAVKFATGKIHLRPRKWQIKGQSEKALDVFQRLKLKKQF